MLRSTAGVPIHSTNDIVHPADSEARLAFYGESVS